MKQLKTLKEWGAEKPYNTDKFDLGYIDHFYDKVLKEGRSKAKNVMEIGVAGGGSLELWRDYYPKKTNIHAIDIHHFEIEGIKRKVGDAYTEEMASRFKDDYFDVIIDDGTHNLDDWYKLVDLYLPKVKEGGRLIIEDVIPPRPEFKMGATQGQIDNLISHILDAGATAVSHHDMTGLAKRPELQNLNFAILEIRK
jgi:23S rRNA U2552 (ribose-2'-O)-methylase RlmE/FtsJ